MAILGLFLRQYVLLLFAQAGEDGTAQDASASGFGAEGVGGFFLFGEEHQA